MEVLGLRIQGFRVSGFWGFRFLVRGGRVTWNQLVGKMMEINHPKLNISRNNDGTKPA